MYYKVIKCIQQSFNRIYKMIQLLITFNKVKYNKIKIHKNEKRENILF